MSTFIQHLTVSAKTSKTKPTNITIDPGLNSGTPTTNQSGTTVTTNQKVRILASGEVNLCVNATDYMSHPCGISPQTTKENGTFADTNLGALVAFVTDSDSKRVNAKAISEIIQDKEVYQLEYSVPESASGGTLGFCVNDYNENSGDYSDNSGSYEVTVFVESPKLESLTEVSTLWFELDIDGDPPTVTAKYKTAADDSYQVYSGTDIEDHWKHNSNASTVSVLVSEGQKAKDAQYKVVWKSTKFTASSYAPGSSPTTSQSLTLAIPTSSSASSTAYNPRQLKLGLQKAGSDPLWFDPIVIIKRDPT